MSTLTALYACWEVNPVWKSCYFQWGKNSGRYFNGKRNTSWSQHIVAGLGNWLCFFCCFCSKPAFRSTLCCHSAAALFSDVFLAQVCHCRFLHRFGTALFSHRHCQARIYMCILLLNLAVPLARVNTLLGIDCLSNCQALPTPSAWALKLLPWTLDFATNCPWEWLQERWTNFISWALIG